MAQRGLIFFKGQATFFVDRSDEITASFVKREIEQKEIAYDRTKASLTP